jgi:dynein heavy chain
MVLPDLGLICEIMLMAEGFQMKQILSRKFVILYRLWGSVSKSRHYDCRAACDQASSTLRAA